MVAHGLGRVDVPGCPTAPRSRSTGSSSRSQSGVVVDGTVTVPWTGECRRCLTEIDGTLERRDPRDLRDPSHRGRDLAARRRRPRSGADAPRHRAARAAPGAAVHAGLPGPGAGRVPGGQRRRPADASVRRDPARDPRWSALDQLRPTERLAPTLRDESARSFGRMAERRPRQTARGDESTAVADPASASRFAGRGVARYAVPLAPGGPSSAAAPLGHPLAPTQGTSSWPSRRRRPPSRRAEAGGPRPGRSTCPPGASARAAGRPRCPTSSAATAAGTTAVRPSTSIDRSAEPTPRRRRRP